MPLRLARHAVQPLEELLRAETYVPRPGAQGRYLQLEHVQPVKEVLAEGALGGQLLQAAVRGGDDADVKLYLLAAADAGYAVGLHSAQELGLELDGQLRDLVEEERAVVGELKAPRVAARGLRPGEGSRLVAEELALEQVARDGGAVYGHKGAVGVAALVVHGLGEELLARAALALDEDVAVVARIAPGEGYGLFHAGVAGIDILEGVYGAVAADLVDGVDEVCLLLERYAEGARVVLHRGRDRDGAVQHPVPGDEAGVIRKAAAAAAPVHGVPADVGHEAAEVAALQLLQAQAEQPPRGAVHPDGAVVVLAEQDYAVRAAL